MSDHKDDLLKKLKSMSQEDLWTYYLAAKNTNRVCNFTGIGILFLMILYFNLITLVIGAFIMYFVSNFSVGIGQTIGVIKEQLEKYENN
jgi:hypothetical protein